MSYQPRPSEDQIKRMPRNPLRIMMSKCLVGDACQWDGVAFDMQGFIPELLALPNVEHVVYCPEESAFGTPRELSDIEGGDGFDVLKGDARVITPSGADWTDSMIGTAERMAAIALSRKVDVAIMLDISAACGSQVIYMGQRAKGIYQAGVGVAAAAMIRAGIPVVSQRDMRTLGRIRAHVDPSFTPDPTWIDHHESVWYQKTFGE